MKQMSNRTRITYYAGLLDGEQRASNVARNDNKVREEDVGRPEEEPVGGKGSRHPETIPDVLNLHPSGPFRRNCFKVPESMLVFRDVASSTQNRVRLIPQIIHFVSDQITPPQKLIGAACAPWKRSLPSE